MTFKLFLSIMLLFVLVSFLSVGSVGASSEMWSQTYGGTSIDCAETLVQTSDRGYALAGDSWPIDTGDTDFWLVKTDEYGDMEWNQMYGGEGLEDAYALVETSDGGYAIAGTTNRDSWLVKTDSYGNMEWNKTYGGSEPDRAYALVETSDGGFALAGSSLLVKTDAYGNMEWNQTYDEGRINSLVKTSDGGYALAGTKNNDFWLAKTDEHGIIPEFPSWIILPLFLTVTLVVAICRRKLSKANNPSFILGA